MLGGQTEKNVGAILLVIEPKGKYGVINGKNVGLTIKIRLLSNLIIKL